MLLAVTALATLQPVAPRELVWLDGVTVMTAVPVLAFIYGTVNHLIANAPDLARLRS